MLVITNTPLNKTEAMSIVLPTDIIGNKDIKVTKAMSHHKRIKYEFKRKSIPSGLNKRATKAYISSITHYHFRLGDAVKLSIVSATKSKPYNFRYLCIIPLYKDLIKSERKDIYKAIRTFSYKYKELMLYTIAFPALELIGDKPQASVRRTNMLIDAILDTDISKNNDIYIHVPANMLNVIGKRLLASNTNKKDYKIVKVENTILKGKKHASNRIKHRRN